MKPEDVMAVMHDLGLTEGDTWTRGDLLAHLHNAASVQVDEIREPTEPGARLSAGRAEYSAVIVTACTRMPPGSVEKLVEFVGNGGEVIFIAHPPGMAPGVADQDARTKRLQTILREVLDQSWPKRAHVWGSP